MPGTVDQQATLPHAIRSDASRPAGTAGADDFDNLINKSPLIQQSQNVTSIINNQSSRREVAVSDQGQASLVHIQGSQAAAGLSSSSQDNQQ